MKTIKTLGLSLFMTLTFSAAAYAHCGSCGAGEAAKDHKHGDHNAECMKKCEGTEDKASCKKGCAQHHKAEAKAEVKAKKAEVKAIKAEVKAIKADVKAKKANVQAKKANVQAKKAKVKAKVLEAK